MSVAREGISWNGSWWLEMTVIFRRSEGCIHIRNYTLLRSSTVVLSKKAYLLVQRNSLGELFVSFSLLGYPSKCVARSKAHSNSVFPLLTRRKHKRLLQSTIQRAVYSAGAVLLL